MLSGLLFAAALAAASPKAAPPAPAPAILAQPAAPSAAVQPFVKVTAPRIFLMGVRVIDGTGAPPLENRIVILADGKIQGVLDGMTSRIGPDSADLSYTDGRGRQTLRLSGQ